MGEITNMQNKKWKEKVAMETEEILKQSKETVLLTSMQMLWRSRWNGWFPRKMKFTCLIEPFRDRKFKQTISYGRNIKSYQEATLQGNFINYLKSR